jgi:DNA adenine methylase
MNGLADRPASPPFPYPGAKTRLAPWIIDHLPQHQCFVEVFGGSGALTWRKTASTVEVFNDLDDDIVHFFRTLRESGDELHERLNHLPHSREVHRRFARDYYRGLRPTDDVERAARWFYLRCTQFAAKYAGASGYNGAQKRNPARKMRNYVERLETVRERFLGVEIEHLDYRDLFDRYDAPDTLWYCDPPYQEEGDALYTHAGRFDWGDFVDEVRELEGDTVVSCRRVPDGLSGWEVRGVDIADRMRQGVDDWSNEARELLVTSYDPASRPRFVNAQQSTLADGHGDRDHREGDP